MNEKTKTIIICSLISFVLIIFIQIIYKTNKYGNNISKSKEDLVEYILNISSYEASLTVTINSNKTSNKYNLHQMYLNPSYYKQIVEHPENIKNLETTYNGKELKIKNTNLGTEKIYQNFKYINNNKIWLNSFIKNCTENGYNIQENELEILVENKEKEILSISKQTKLPTSLKINDNNTRIYIEYKEIKVNSIKDNNFLN